MKRILTILLLLIVAETCRASDVALKTGYIKTVTYHVDQHGEPTGEKRIEQFWFSESYTRSEVGGLYSVSTSIPPSREIYPEAGRYKWDNPWDVKKVSYLELCRKTFHENFLYYHLRTPPEHVTLKGIPCLRYSGYHEAEPYKEEYGDMRSASPAVNVTYWVYAKENAPIVLQEETSLGYRCELIEFKPNCTIPEGTFPNTDHLKPVIPFDLPKGSFLLELTTTTTEKDNPDWRDVDTRIFKGDGKQITQSYSSIYNDGHGKITDFKGKDKVFPYERFGYLNQLVTFSNWASIKQIGHEKLPIGEADVFEYLGNRISERIWIVDDPVWGSILAKRETTSGSTQNTWEITKLETNTL
jgi:hypothetical protein